MNKGIPGRHGFPMKGTEARTFFFGMRMSKDENDAIERAAQRFGMTKTDTVLYAISQLEHMKPPAKTRQKAAENGDEI